MVGKYFKRAWPVKRGSEQKPRTSARVVGSLAYRAFSMVFLDLVSRTIRSINSMVSFKNLNVASLSDNFPRTKRSEKPVNITGVFGYNRMSPSVAVMRSTACLE